MRKYFLIIGIILILLFLPKILEAQLLRPTYSICPDIDYPQDDINIRLIVGDNINDTIRKAIENPENYPIFLSDTTQSSWIGIRVINNSLIEFIPRKSATEEDLEKDVYVIGRINPDCSDTLHHFKIDYSSKYFKRIRYLSNIEAGFILSRVNYSVKSIYGDENYSQGYYYGFLVGLDLVEFATPEILSGFKINIGTKFRYNGLEGTIGDSLSSVNSMFEIALNLGAEIPLDFVGSALEDISANTYLTLPGMSFSQINANDETEKTNDISTLNLAYGFGLKYYMSESVCFGLRFIMNEYQSTNSKRPEGSKIAYDLFRTEFTVSLLNIFEDLW